MSVDNPCPTPLHTTLYAPPPPCAHPSPSILHTRRDINREGACNLEHQGNAKLIQNKNSIYVHLMLILNIIF